MLFWVVPFATKLVGVLGAWVSPPPEPENSNAPMSGLDPLYAKLNPKPDVQVNEVSIVSVLLL